MTSRTVLPKSEPLPEFSKLFSGPYETYCPNFMIIHVQVFNFLIADRQERVKSVRMLTCGGGNIKDITGMKVSVCQCGLM